jgi:hypothetical protein
VPLPMSVHLERSQNDIKKEGALEEVASGEKIMCYRVSALCWPAAICGDRVCAPRGLSSPSVRLHHHSTGIQWQRPARSAWRRICFWPFFNCLIIQRGPRRAGGEHPGKATLAALIRASSRAHTHNRSLVAAATSAHHRRRGPLSLVLGPRQLN